MTKHIMPTSVDPQTYPIVGTLHDPWRMEALRLLTQASARLHHLDTVARLWPDSLGCREMLKLINRALADLDGGIEQLPIKAGCTQEIKGGGG